jgi:hypothetical protein
MKSGKLKRAVRRNIERFPADFMFEMNEKEFGYWRSQFGPSSCEGHQNVSNKDEAENLRSQFGPSSWGGTRYVPMVFTEQDPFSKP